MTEILSRTQIEDIAGSQLYAKMKSLAEEILLPKGAERLPTGLAPTVHDVCEDQNFLRAVSIGLLIAAGKWGTRIRMPSGRDWQFQVLDERGEQDG